MTLTEIMAVVLGLFLGFGAVNRLLSGRMHDSERKSAPRQDDAPALRLEATGIREPAWFDVLGVDVDADLETIRLARATLLEHCRLAGASPDQTRQRQADMQARQIEAAYLRAVAERD